MDFGQLVLLCCFVPAGILIVAGFLIVQNFPRFLKALPQFTAPDTEELQQQFAALKSANPQSGESELVRKIINQYALRQGIVGAVTSLGGFIALPLGLSIDLVYSARSNASLSYFIAQVYGIKNENQTLNLGQLLVLKKRAISVDEMVMWQEQFAGVAYQEFIRAILQKSIAKIIPGAGAVIGFIVNYSSVQFFGTLADQYYKGNLNKLIGTVGDNLKTITEMNPDQRQQIWQRFKESGTQLLGTGATGLSGIVSKLQARNYDPTADRVSQLEKLAAMHKEGILTTDEFNTMKQAVMGGLAEAMDKAEGDVQSGATS
jgi:hypothetical protein